MKIIHGYGSKWWSCMESHSPTIYCNTIYSSEIEIPCIAQDIYLRRMPSKVVAVLSLCGILTPPEPIRTFAWIFDYFKYILNLFAEYIVAMLTVSLRCMSNMKSAQHNIPRERAHTFTYRTMETLTKLDCEIYASRYLMFDGYIIMRKMLS